MDHASISTLRPLWRRRSGRHEWATPYGWSPDGSRALFDLSHNDGDCYGYHIRTDDLMTITDSQPHRESGVSP